MNAPLISVAQRNPPNAATAALAAIARSEPPEAPEQPYRRALAALAAYPDTALALSVRLPFCAVRCLCCERDLQVAQPRDMIEDYVDGLVDEMNTLADCVGVRHDVLRLHLGGGTASELSESQLARLVHALQAHWRLPAEADLSAEIDPRQARGLQFELLFGLGFRSLSFDVMDLDPLVQHAIGGSHSAALIDDVCGRARNAGITTINLDLLLGLPHQTPASWRSTLQQVVAVGPERVTLRHYRHRPTRVAAHRAIDADALPGAQGCRELETLTAELLCESGYRRIGKHRFGVDGDLPPAGFELRQWDGLTGAEPTPSTPALGLGAGAAGCIDGRHYWHEAALPSWRQAVREGRLPVVRSQGSTRHGDGALWPA